MIEFSGKFSESSEDLLVKILARGLRLSISIVAIIGVIIVLVIAAVLNTWILTIFIVAFAFVVLVFSIAPYTKNERKKTLLKMLPQKVIIDEDNSIDVEWIDYSVSKSINDVKIIFDFGENYLIKFKIPKGRVVFCQKDLLVEGTIEEFEELFQGKIIRKTTK